jgi:hypothetical protein
MRRINRRVILGLGLAGGIGFVASFSAGQQPKTPVPGQLLNITVTAATPAPSVSLALGARSGKVTPVRSGYTHTGGGNIDVQQPAPDTVVITMAGVAVAYGGPTKPAAASQVFDLVQQFEVSFDAPEVKAAKLTLEGRLIGFLRSHQVGTAEVCAEATLAGGAEASRSLVMPAHAVSGSENVSINDKEGPAGIVVGAGKYTLTQSFKVTATMPKCVLPCRAPSAEFAPDPALEPLWISEKEPFKGAKKADLGFQITIKVSPEASPPRK